MLIEGKIDLANYLDDLCDEVSVDLIQRLATSSAVGVQPLKQQLIVVADGQSVGGYNKQAGHWFLKVKYLAHAERLDKSPWPVPEGFVWCNHPISNPHLRIGGPMAASKFCAALEHLIGCPI